MPYQHCPNCRLTIHIADDEVEGGPCPRCAATLADHPRSLFAEATGSIGRFARQPGRLSPETVRGVLAARGGRYKPAD
jgi:hypothetical protein